MKVIFNEKFYEAYTSDPAAAEGRMEAIVDVIKSNVDFVTAEPAAESQIALAHSSSHIRDVKENSLYPIAALAAGGAIQAARIGLREPAFALIRPPGHHASRGSSWGFCYFNNMAVALLTMLEEGIIKKALVLDIDLHFGDGTVNILAEEDRVPITSCTCLSCG